MCHRLNFHRSGGRYRIVFAVNPYLLLHHSSEVFKRVWSQKWWVTGRPRPMDPKGFTNPRKGGGVFYFFFFSPSRLAKKKNGKIGVNNGQFCELWAGDIH